ncbi:hypothetical protein WJX75_007665 [Coccomyxa subellipsoidea]|uniref:thiamine phosphate synthase n=1 Tax=Coccomyxa subellipsoidea TaxID=248742 RepID=A0ABR2YFJ1_9CHLO
MTTQERLTELLWADCELDILRALHHPFIHFLGAGTLSRESFQFYIAQDAHFLAAFSLAYTAAARKAAKLNDKTIAAQLLTLHEGVAKELELHGSYAKEWGVDLADMLHPSKATKAYVDFLEEVAETEDVVYILAAMLPCSRLYGFLGEELAAAYPQASHAYTDWILTYSSPAYLALPAIKEALLDNLGHNADFGRLRKLYRTAMQLELDFFQAASMTHASPRVGVLVLDFDETLTVSDSTSVIIETAIEAAETTAKKGEKASVREGLEAKRDELVKNYAGERDALLDDLLPTAEPSTPPPFDMTWMAEFVDELSSFDRRMNTAVIDSGILAGVPANALARKGRTVPIQKGAVSFLRQARQAGVVTHVVSVSWSAEMVRGALRGRIGVAHSEETARPGQVVVHANDLECSDGLSTGRLERRIECGVDKAAVLDSLLLKKAARRQGPGGRSLSVYVGDSMSDLAPLLSVDLGIVIGQNKLLRRVASAAGITLKPLVAAPLEGKSEEGTLYEARSWPEVEAFLFGSSAAQPPPIQVPRVLTIAGSDSGGGAGIQADLKTFQACGVYGASAITALTEQNTHGVRGFHTVPIQNLKGQIDAVLEDIGADVVKTGMLPTAEVVEAVADRIVEHRVSCLVVDPVLISTSGHSLGDSDVARALVDRLFPLATIITPNLPEASAILGDMPITDLEGMKAAAIDLHALGPQCVLVKGGHLQQDGGEALDVLYDGETVQVVAGPRIDTPNTHGTGCSTASAIAAELAKGASPVQAVQAAKAYVSGALQASAALRIGSGSQTPFNHGYATADWSAQEQASRLDLRLYAVTDPRQNERMRRSNVEAVSAAIDGGITVVQLREKDVDGGDFLAEAVAVIKIARPRGVPVIINDRVDVALAADADGAHIGQSDLPAAAARRLLGPNKILGVSCKTVEQAVTAEAAGADYVGSGAVYATNTKDSPIMPLERLADICAAVSIPVVAIGGITADNAAPTIEAGCAGVAVVSAIFGAEDPKAAAAGILEIVDSKLGL